MSLDTAEAAADCHSLLELEAVITRCRACPRLVQWREAVAVSKRAAYRDETYWARPVPGWGDERAAVVIVGLAPAAHGGNRTGRMFTGDRSGDVLFAALHRTGFASQPLSVHAGDGLVLKDARVTAPVHCAPPDNKPTVGERDRCAAYLARELELLGPQLKVAVVLGGFGWQTLLSTLDGLGWTVPRPRPKFGHGAVATITHGNRRLTMVGSYHVSQQNTFTGRLTPDMLDQVLRQAREIAGLG